MFVADVAQGNYSAESLKPMGRDKSKAPPSKEAPVSTARQEDPLYLAIVVGVLTALVILVAVAVLVAVHRHRHRKCFASPLAAAPSKRSRDTYRYFTYTNIIEELDGLAVSALRRAIGEVKQQIIGWVTKNLLYRAPVCFRRHVKPLVPAAFAVVSTHQPALGPRGGYGPLSLCITHKEDLCPSSGDINSLMGNILYTIIFTYRHNQGNIKK
jgi:hypothetical protein